MLYLRRFLGHMNSTPFHIDSALLKDARPGKRPFVFEDKEHEIPLAHHPIDSAKTHISIRQAA